eukprot:1158975-Pelagomonas_calceolata.AAC.30
MDAEPSVHAFPLYPRCPDELKSEVSPPLKRLYQALMLALLLHQRPQLCHTQTFKCHSTPCPCKVLGGSTQKQAQGYLFCLQREAVQARTYGNLNRHTSSH